MCGKHRADGMVDVHNKRCTHPGCTTKPSYGIPGFAATLCAVHKEHSSGVIRFSKARCACKQPATHGIRAPQRCEQHQIEGDLNLVERPCGSCGLTFRLDPGTLKCVYCDPHNVHTGRLAKQREVAQYLRHHVPAWTSSDTIPADLAACKDRERPDFLWDRDGWCVVLEVDEDQHAGRPELCECTRMVNVSQDLGRVTFWVRYNPDRYTPAVAGQRQVKPLARLAELARCLNRVISKMPVPDDVTSGGGGPAVFRRLLGYDKLAVFLKKYIKKIKGDLRAAAADRAPLWFRQVASSIDDVPFQRTS